MSTPDSSYSNPIITFQKRQVADVYNLSAIAVPLIDPTDYSGASNYYAMSSLVSNATFQSRYIVPPTTKMHLYWTSAAGTAGPTETGFVGEYIGPSGPIYEFPNWPNNGPTSSSKLAVEDTLLINWSHTAGQSQFPNDPGIEWFDSSSLTPWEVSEGGSERVENPLLNLQTVSSNFLYLKDTKEYRELSAATKNVPQINDLSARISKIEQFLGNFSTINISHQANWYLGLSGNISPPVELSGNWKNIYKAGLWRQLV